MIYTDEFFARNRESARAAARKVMPWVLAQVNPSSVIDVGCGAGEWGAVAQDAGITTLGIDGFASRCAITDFAAADLEDGVSCRGFDLAICLEVAEHVSEASADKLVAGLCEAKTVLFSAAHPGQGGVGHVNEQWGTWWAEKFAVHGFYGSSDIKWQFWTDVDVADFYRENMLLFERGNEPGVVDVIHPERLKLPGGGTWSS